MTTPMHTSSPPLHLSLRWRWGSRQPISFLMQQAVQNPQVISLAAGLVDQASLPAHEVRSACAGMLADESQAKQALQYGTTPGAERLRRQLLDHLARLEHCTPGELGISADQLVLTTGSQQMLSLVSEVLVDPGDVVLVAAPTYFAYLGTLHGVGARAVAIPADAEGMQIDALEGALQHLEAAGELPRVKLIYLVSYYENPSGISLSAGRREAVVDLARRWSKQQRILILEDAAYRELRYSGPELPSVWGFDTSRDGVILAQTFSKSFSPGLRVGYGVLPRDLVGPIHDRKGNEDFGSANFNQHLLATVFERGLYYDHVEMLRNVYRTKRDAMLAAADRFFSGVPGVEWVHPHGGLYVWMTLPSHIETGFDSPLFERATKVERVMYVPGEVCYASSLDPRPKNQMRLSYGTQDATGIEQGMERLSRAVRALV